MIAGYEDDYIDSIVPMNLGWESYFDGDYYQPQNPQIVSERRSMIEAKRQTRSIGTMSLDLYQGFTELDWLRPHGNFRTVIKMEHHFIDEYQEFVETNDTARKSRLDKLLDNDSHNVVSELGDIGWFFSAFATNAGINVSHAWKDRLSIEAPEYLGDHSMTLNEIDDAISTGYFPRMGIFDLDENTAIDLLFAAGFVTIGTKIILEDNNEGSEIAVMNKQRDVGRWLTNGIGLITLHAQSVGSSLVEVVEENIRKVSVRAEKKTLSNKKNRTAEEL
jgi:NTP pyrophosphatase (non-canonical NTP hydrolase)